MTSNFMFGPRSTPRFSTVTAAFYHHVLTNPEVVAARDFTSVETGQVTYGELAKRASRLARELRQLGVAPGDRVPLVVKRGIDMLVGIVAILSCGAQYVPLDGGVVPDTTLKHVIKQTGGSSSTVLVLKSTQYRVEASEVANVVVIDEDNQNEEDLYSQTLGLEDLAEPDHGCYVIYTSGMYLLFFIFPKDEENILTLSQVLREHLKVWTSHTAMSPICFATVPETWALRRGLALVRFSILALIWVCLLFLS